MHRAPFLNVRVDEIDSCRFVLDIYHTPLIVYLSLITSVVQKAICHEQTTTMATDVDCKVGTLFAIELVEAYYQLEIRRS